MKTGISSLINFGVNNLLKRTSIVVYNAYNCISILQLYMLNILASTTNIQVFYLILFYTIII